MQIVNIATIIILLSNMKRKKEDIWCQKMIINYALSGNYVDFPCILVRNTNHYTIRGHQIGNKVVSQSVELVTVRVSLGSIYSFFE